MAQQRDYEDQPEAPDLGASVQAEAAETLTGPAGADPLDAGYVPPDRPYGLDDEGITPAALRDGDTLDERLHRERPEDEPADPDRSGRIELAGEQGAALETGDAVAGADVGIDGGSASAEEAAVHEVDVGAEDPDDRTAADAADRLTQDPAVDAAEVDAARDARATDAAEGDGRDAAAAIDELSEAGGAAAPASGRADAGPSGRT